MSTPRGAASAAAQGNARSRDTSGPGELEALECRLLRSTTPNWAGIYVGKTGSTRVEVVLNASKTKGHFSGTLEDGTKDYSLAAHVNGKDLVGDLTRSKKTYSYKAKLDTEELVSTTLGATLKANLQVSQKLVHRSSKNYTFSAPANWVEREGTNGMAIASPDGNELVAVVGGQVGYDVEPSAAAEYVEEGGGIILGQKSLGAGYTSSGYVAGAEYGARFTASNRKVYDTVMKVVTYTASNQQTAMFIATITAPLSTFLSEAPTLLNIAASIERKSTTTPAFVAKPAVDKGKGSHIARPSDVGDIWPVFFDQFGGLFDPGVDGNWDPGGDLDYANDPFLYYEQEVVSDQETAMDDSVDAFDDELTGNYDSGDDGSDDGDDD